MNKKEQYLTNSKCFDLSTEQKKNRETEEIEKLKNYPVSDISKCNKMTERDLYIIK